MMPTVATMVNAGRTGKAPTSVRNSLTKLLVPGSESVARPAIRKRPASSGARRATPPSAPRRRAPAQQGRQAGPAAVRADLAGPAPGDEHPDDDEQQGDGDAVHDHVQHRAR